MSVTVSDVAQILIATSSLVLSAVVFIHTRRSAALESLRAVRDSWMQLDAAVLADERNLLAADRLFHPGAPSDIEQARKRWILFITLNPVVSDFMAARAGLTPDAADTIAQCRVTLRALLHDADAYALTQNGAYARPFQKLCREVHEELHAARSVADVTTVACSAT